MPTPLAFLEDWTIRLRYGRFQLVYTDRCVDCDNKITHQANQRALLEFMECIVSWPEYFKVSVYFHRRLKRQLLEWSLSSYPAWTCPGVPFALERHARTRNVPGKITPNHSLALVGSCELKFVKMWTAVCDQHNVACDRTVLPVAWHRRRSRHNPSQSWYDLKSD